MSLNTTAASTRTALPTMAHATTRARVTRALLGCGLVAGPAYVTVSLAQALTHEGFDLTRHDWSLLAAGPWGWIQSTNLVVTGLLVIAVAVGAARAGAGRVTAWLVAAYGLGMVGGGLMAADPWGGYPVGAPPTTTLSWHGAGHMVAGLLGFACLIAATGVVARRALRDGRRGAALASAAVGVLFLGGMVGVSSGSSTPLVTLGFTAGVLAVWAWLAALAVHLRRRVSSDAW